MGNWTSRLPVEMFQFLIGSLEASHIKITSRIYPFQFLIGSLEACQRAGISCLKSTRVSIPHR